MSLKESLKNNSEKICRVCLSKYGKFHIFTSNRVDSMIMSVTDLEIEENDGFPSYICTNCFKELQIAVGFKQKCEGSDSVLRFRRRMVNTNITREASALEDMNIFEPNVEITEHMSNEEIFADADPFYCSSLLECHLEEPTYKGLQPERIKTEEEDYESQLNNNSTKLLLKKISRNTSIEIIKRQSYTTNNNKINFNNIKKKQKINNTGVMTILSTAKPKMNSKTPKQYICPICDKNFQASSNLSRHLKIHTNDKPYQCHICMKSFRRPDNLQQHIVVHTDQKPYGCHLCDKTFKRANHVLKHLKTHTANDKLDSFIEAENV